MAFVERENETSQELNFLLTKDSKSESSASSIINKPGYSVPMTNSQLQEASNSFFDASLMDSIAENIDARSVTNGPSAIRTHTSASFSTSPLQPYASSNKNVLNTSVIMSPVEGLPYTPYAGTIRNDGERHVMSEASWHILNESVSYIEIGARILQTMRVSIPRAAVCNSPEGDFAVYEILIMTSIGQWSLHRRYREFSDLHLKIIEDFRAEGLQPPTLPPKKLFGSSTSPSFIQERRISLQMYIRKLCSNSEFWQSEALLRFLDTETSMFEMQAKVMCALNQIDLLDAQCAEQKSQLSSASAQIKDHEETIEKLKQSVVDLKQDKENYLADPAREGDLHLKQSKRVAALDKKNRDARITVPEIPTGCMTYSTSLNPHQEERASGASFGKSIMPVSGRMNSSSYSVGSYYSNVRTHGSIDMSDLDNLVKRVSSVTQLTSYGDQNNEDDDDEDDGVDDILLQHHNLINSSSAYSLGSAANISQSPGNYGFSYPTGYSDSVNQQISSALRTTMMLQDEAKNEVSILANVAIMAPSQGQWGMIEGQQSEGQVQSLGFLGLQRGTSIVGDPDDPLFQTNKDSQSRSGVVSTDITRAIPQQAPSRARDREHGTWMASGSSFGLPGMNVGIIGISMGDGDGGNQKNEGGTWDVSRGLVLMTGQAEKTDPGLGIDLIPRNVHPLAIDRRVDDLLNQLQPSPAAENYRRSVFTFVSQLVKKALGAQCFPVGGYALRTFLPDEEVGVSAFLCHGQEATWFIRVNETLCKASASTLNASVSSKVDFKSNRVDSTGGVPQSSMTFEHQLSNVNFVNLGHMQRIKCVVDNQVAVDISANQLEELCAVAFEEEIDRLLGKNHLFKRSLLLIKAWWLYESRAYTGTNMMACISERALTALILAVLNKNHRQLFTPIQVMAMFFYTYGNFDWSVHCVGIDGDRLVSGAAKEGSWDPIQQLHDPLVGPDLLARYRERCRTGEKSADCPAVSKAFVTRHMNVINPLNPSENLIAGAVNARRANRVIHLFHITARNLQPVLLYLKREATKAQRRQQQPPPTYQHTTSITMLDTFFSLSWSRFGQGWRPDVPPQFDTDQDELLPLNYGGDYNRFPDPLGVDLNNVWDNIKYCSFLLDAEVTDSALFALSKEILNERGPLPVGEIGKLLQEFTANPGLSQTLKDQFGGLKKFLEKFPDEFLISSDHQFNPHVYLRTAMSEEEIDVILHGGTGPGIMKKGKKGPNRRSNGVANLPNKQYQAPPKPVHTQNVQGLEPPGLPHGALGMPQYRHFAPPPQGIHVPPTATGQILASFYEQELTPQMYPVRGFRQPLDPYRNHQGDLYYSSGTKR